MAEGAPRAEVHDLLRWRGGAALGVLLGLLVLLGLGVLAARYMAVHGHIVTGMHNHVVWGLPHVVAVYLLLCASGVLHVASLSSVFGRAAYAPYARLSAALGLCLLSGGLAIVALDLGRPERLIIALTHATFTSVFAWNIVLYTVFALVVAAYLGAAMARRRQAAVGRWGRAALVSRVALTTGTGCIFAVLLARDAFAAAILVPLFLALSLAQGTALFVLALSALAALGGRPLDTALLRRLLMLTGWFVLAVLWLEGVSRLLGAQSPGLREWQHFVAQAGGGYSTAYWVGQWLFGALVPLAMIHSPLATARLWLLVAAALVVLGGLCQLYVLIIAGQAYPQPLLEGWTVLHSTALDGQVAPYAPTLVEVGLGLGGVALAGLLALLALRVLPLWPVAEHPQPGA